MAKNSSSLNDSLIHPHLFLLDQELSCHISRPSSFILTTYYITNIFLLLPLCIFIFCSGFQQWHSNHSTTRRAMSHSDCFTYHLATMELINVLNCISNCCGVYRKDLYLIFVGNFFTSLIWHGQTFLHMLTCVEHYLAVAYPIFYLSLRKDRGIKLRNITVCCVWLLSFVGMGLMAIQTFLALLDLCILIINLAVVSFCSFSVLFNLHRPLPGDREVGKRRVNQDKQRACKTVIIILVVQVLRFIGSVIWAIVDVLKYDSYCLMVAFGILINLPASLVLPLLFLQREGRLVCCKKIQFLQKNNNT